MGLNILLKDFVVKPAPQVELLYRARKDALEELENASKAFFENSSLEKVVVQETKFANPTWISLGTDIGYTKKEAEKYRKNENHIIVGNGGSIEPAWAIYKALIELTGKARIIPADSSNPDDEGIRAINKPNPKINQQNTIVYVVSKSGNTLNIILQTLAFMEAGYTIVPITEDKPSALKSIIDKKGIEFIVHTNVGGRFTANQPNALVPVYATAMHNNIETSIDSFVKGLNEMGQIVRPDVPVDTNPSKRIALLLYKTELAGYNEIYMLIYSKKLMGAAGLITQLVHESYGKNLSGQTILAMEGPECQHHTNQRFFGGQRNMVGIFVGVENYNNEIVEDVSEFEDTDLKGIGELKALQGSKFSDLLKYERIGVYMTAKSAGIPVIDIVLDSVDGDSVGKFIGLIQGVVMYSAFLRGNKWEDQPAVEDSKNKTIELCMNKNPVFEYWSSSIRV